VPKTNGIPAKSTIPQRDIYQLRTYAAHRAVIAVDRAIHIASIGSSGDREQALCWMRLWMAFAASRPISSPANAMVKAA
jgi:hypothetical protein